MWPELFGRRDFPIGEGDYCIGTCHQVCNQNDKKIIDGDQNKHDIMKKFAHLFVLSFTFVIPWC